MLLIRGNLQKFISFISIISIINTFIDFIDVLQEEIVRYRFASEMNSNRRVTIQQPTYLT